MKEIRVFYLDPKSNTAEERTITDSLETFYELIGCQLVEFATRSIGRKRRYFDIICDEEGVFVDSPYISAINEYGDPMLVGSLIIIGGADDEGELVGLTDNDIAYIKRFVHRLSTRNHPEEYPMLTCVNY